MSTSIGIGWSKAPDSLTAGKQAATSSKQALGQENVDLAIVFSTLRFDLGVLLKGITQTLDSDNIVGCSAASIITSEAIEKKAVIVMTIASSKLKFKLGQVRGIQPDKENDAGRELATHTLKEFTGGQRDLFMLFSDGLINDTSNLIRGVQEVLGKSFPVIGASSSDDLNFSSTYQFFGQDVLQNSAVGILWTGGTDFSIGIHHGWKPLGRPRLVTKSYRNIVKQIDGLPAIKVYEDYFGEKIQELRSLSLANMAILYPLGLYLTAEKDYLLRNVLGAREDGALIFQGDIPEGAEIRIMIGTKDSALEAARQAAQEAKVGLREKKIKTALIFDSVSRNKLLGQSAYKEIEIVKGVLGKDVPIMGFYTYGEQAPLKALDYEGETHFHNQTINIFALGG